MQLRNGASFGFSNLNPMIYAGGIYTPRLVTMFRKCKWKNNEASTIEPFDMPRAFNGTLFEIIEMLHGWAPRTFA